MLKKLKSEAIRFKRFQLALLGEVTEIKVSDEDIKNYVKFILKDGDIIEKRNILESFESEFVLKKKRVSLI